MIEEIEKSFLFYFGTHPTLIVRSPGRINLIGEHTDYNGGFVLPAAVDKSIVLAFGPRQDSEVRLQALNLNDFYHLTKGPFKITNKKSGKGWPDYVLGVLLELEKLNLKWSGFNCTIGGDLPLGAGMSSSAALECGILFGLNRLFNHRLKPREIALLAQKAENEFVGVKCGIMDQFANVFGRKGNALRLDCSSQDFEYVPFTHEGIDIVLCDTGVKHSLAGSEYNARRKECEKGVAAMRFLNPDISNLRKASLKELSFVKEKISKQAYRRCKYVIDENARVIDACKDLKENDLVGFGQKMFATHEGLRNEYSVSCPELDFLVDLARKADGVLGARMMGGGFGGCTINLVKKNDTAEFLRIAANAYQSEFGIPLQSYQVELADGVHLVKR